MAEMKEENNKYYPPEEFVEQAYVNSRESTKRCGNSQLRTRKHSGATLRKNCSGLRNG